MSARIHRKTLRGGANFIVTSPEVASILEFTAGFRAAVTVDGDRGTGWRCQGRSALQEARRLRRSLLPVRNVVLVGRRGGSFLESGYRLRSLRPATGHSHHLRCRGLRAP